MTTKPKKEKQTGSEKLLCPKACILDQARRQPPQQWYALHHEDLVINTLLKLKSSGSMHSHFSNNAALQ